MRTNSFSYPLEKDEDTPEEERHLKVELEQPQCGRENSNSDGVPWKLPATGPLSGVEKTEPSFPEIFMNTLKYLQTHEYLLDVDLWRLFANLEELSQTSFGFVNSLFHIFKDYVDTSETLPSLDFISVLTKCPVKALVVQR
ncbi:hypothetical protein EI555_018701 [Monodon monoceros]|uniref:Uncharacterized protein n=1 Tax=Monodon monoceros TaxID=40151 RepID=A0A4U1ECR1_MONMO|nr:hypothetical protein EI555_018701 [Monodon monoceros]